MEVTPSEWFWLAMLYLGCGVLVTGAAELVMRAHGRGQGTFRSFSVAVLLWLPYLFIVGLRLLLRR